MKHLLILTEYYPLPQRPDLPQNQLAVHQLCLARGEEERLLILYVPFHRRLRAWRGFLPLLLQSSAPNRHLFQDDLGNDVLLFEHPSILPRTTELYPCFAQKVLRMVRAYMRSNGIAAFDGMAVHFPSRYAILCQRIPARHRMAVLHAFDVKRPFRLRRLKARLPDFDCVACRSPWIAERISKVCPTVGVPELCLSGVPAEVLRRFNAHRPWRPGGVLRLLYAGRLNRNKQPEVLLRAMARLGPAAPVALEVIGSGPEQERLEALSRRLHLTRQVCFRGRLSRNRVMEAMAHSDALALISRSETLGMVYLEAMACGALVIASRGQGVDGVIQHGESGWLLDPNRPVAALAEALAELLHKLLSMKEDEAFAMRERAMAQVRHLEEGAVSRRYLNLVLGAAKEEGCDP